MMNKYLKSHITAAAFCAGVLLAVSCSTSREPRTMRLFMQSGRPNIFRFFVKFGGTSSIVNK